MEAMRRELQQALTTTTPDATQAVDAETKERLAALGYLGGGRRQPRPSRPGATPRTASVS